MEKIINIHIEKLPEGYFLATSEDIQGLVAQGRTIAETIEIARDVAKKLIESGDINISLKSNSLDISTKFDFPIVIGI